MSERTWLYLKIYPGSLVQLDRVIVTVALRIVHENAVEIERWHYLRFVDGDGPHVRFRCLINLDAADAIVSNLGRLEKQAGPQARIDVGYYDPEVRKWGRGYDLSLAEVQFQLASECAAMLISSRTSQRIRRAACEFAFTSICEVLLLDQNSKVAFFETHARWWLGSADLRAAAARVPMPRSEHVPKAFVVAVQDLVCDFRFWCQRHSNPERLVYFAHHLIHLLNNRLGLSPAEEGELAASLWNRVQLSG